MGVVQVVGRADAQVVHALRLRPAPQLLEVTVEALELGEEPDVEAEPVEHADGVVRVGGGNQAVAGVLDGLEVAGRDVAGHAGHRKVFLCRRSRFMKVPPHGRVHDARQARRCHP